MMKAPTIGIDLGTSGSRIGVFINGKVEIIANEYGERTTPSYVAFVGTQCLFGTDAKNQADMNPSNTIFGTYNLIGRKYDDPAIQQTMKNWPFTVKSVDNKPKIVVQYKGGTKEFSPEEILSMLLGELKRTAENYLGKTVTDAVISVPAYFKSYQRRTIIDVARDAGLSVRHVITASTAASFACFSETSPSIESNVLIFDLGKHWDKIHCFSIEHFHEISMNRNQMNITRQFD